MRTTILQLSDGTQISSGALARNAITACSYTQYVNAGSELTLGSVCAAMVELQLFTPAGGLTIAAGDALTLYQQEGQTRRKLGVFLAEKPERPTANTMKLTAYDRVICLDKDLTGWLNGLTGWPYALCDLADMVCKACGLTLASTQLPNGSFLVEKFTAQGITGRQLMQWIAQVAGRFCRATAEGELEFAWYTPAQVHLSGAAADSCYTATDGTVFLRDAAMDNSLSGRVLTLDAPTVTACEADGVLTLTARRRHTYLQNGLTAADYAVAPIEKVQLRSSQEDVGVVYPAETAGTNTYAITANPLLMGRAGEALQPVAQTLFAQLKSVSYTPCTVRLPAGSGIQAGQILTITDKNGRGFTVYVMTCRQTGQQDVLSCTGSHRRDSAAAVNETAYQVLSGRVLNLRTDVDGIRAENKAADGRMASIEMTVDGLRTTVQQQRQTSHELRTELTQLRQTAQAVQVSVQSLRDTGVAKVRTSTDYTLDEQGLKIAKSGELMENRLDNTGMYVTRAGQTLLQAGSDGVVAADVQVRNYLCIGQNARLEDYGSGRTACFYTGG